MAHLFSSSSTDASKSSTSPAATIKNTRTAPHSTTPSTSDSSKELPSSRRLELSQNQNSPETSTASRKASTTIIAEIDVGWGNSVSIRGEGGPLSWDNGIQMEYQDPGSWVWKTHTATPLTFKFLVNDQQWSQGENQTVAAGSTYIGKPNF